MRTVFISYATQDAEFAHRLADDLRRLGVRVWIAPESIRPGESWVRAIERGMEESSHAVIVLTPAALKSKWVEKETDAAIAQERKGRIQVIPLNVEPCAVPLFLSTYQMVSFRRDYDAGLSQLADILDVQVTPPEPEAPAEGTPALAFTRPPPLGHFVTTYNLGQDTYDESFAIETPMGEFLGECGVGISETLGADEPSKKVTAFEVWLFDKSDLRTVTKVLMSPYAYNDDALRAKLASRGDLVLAKLGKDMALETTSLRVDARVVDLEYDSGAMPPQSLFTKLTVELVVCFTEQASYHSPYNKF